MADRARFGPTGREAWRLAGDAGRPTSSRAAAPRRLLVLLVACLAPMCLALGAPASAQTAEAVAQARFEEGRLQYDAGDFGAALDSFRAAMAAVSSPNSRIYVARCLRRLGRLAEAVVEYHLAWREASDMARRQPRYAATRDAAESEREAILDQVGWITVRVTSPPGDVRVSLGGREVPREALGLAMPVDPGRIVVRAEAEGWRPAERAVVIEAGERQSLRLSLRRSSPPEEPEAPEEPRPDPRARRQALMASTIALAGVVVAGAVATGVLYAQGDSLYDQLLDECGGGPCPADRADDIERGRALEGGFVAAVVLTAAAAAVTVVLAALTPWRAPERARAASGLPRASLVVF